MLRKPAQTIIFLLTSLAAIYIFIFPGFLIVMHDALVMSETRLQLLRERERVLVKRARLERIRRERGAYTRETYKRSILHHRRPSNNSHHPHHRHGGPAHPHVFSC